MRQVLQRLEGGATRLVEVPAPACGPNQVLIANRASLISAGTERMVVELAQKSLLSKARERPDQVRRVLQKLQREGVVETVRQVRDQLSGSLALGYSAAGVVLQVGRNVQRFRPGDRVASNGPHAEVVAAPHTLVALIPPAVAFEQACYAVVGAIALQAIRLARVALGSRVAVVGLGLIGQLAVMLLKSAGCRVFGVDPDPRRRALAAELGAAVVENADLADAVGRATDGHGADAVLLAASTPSLEPLELAANIARKRARLVVIGVVGLEVPRRLFYPKELELVVSCSYGPGRYDPAYEDDGRDYPYAYVRWTEGRNIAAVLEQIADGRLPVERLTSHTFALGEAERAYELLADPGQPALGVVLRYPEHGGGPAPVRRSPPAATAARGHGELGVAVVGAGNYAAVVLLPLLAQLPKIRRLWLCSAQGVSAADRGARHGFERTGTDIAEPLGDPATGAVFLATRHHLHVAQALAALRAGKAVFIEKPLAIRPEELEQWEAELAALPAPPLWTVGFNRRFAPAARRARELCRGHGPLALHYRVNAGSVPPDHWTQDLEQGGGRLVGEGCHMLDLCAFLCGCPIVRVHAEAVAGREDQCAVVARLADGSVASIGYFAAGDRALGKERIEIYGGERVLILDDFQTLTVMQGGRRRTQRFARGDKGHRAELRAFVEAVRDGGPPPIPYPELLNSSWAALRTLDALRGGAPQSVPTYSG